MAARVEWDGRERGHESGEKGAVGRDGACVRMRKERSGKQEQERNPVSAFIPFLTQQHTTHPSSSTLAFPS